MNNPYETLNVDPSASKDDVKSAYHKKVKAEHPDAGGNEEQFKEITRAYSILSDDEKRAHYDQYGDCLLYTSDAADE